MNEYQKIISLIDQYGLSRKDRHRKLVYQRFYIYYKLKRHCTTLTEIGELLDVNHTTVIHGINMHYRYWKQKDQVYLNAINPLMHELNHQYSNELTLHVATKRSGIYGEIKISGVIDKQILDNIKEFMTIPEICEKLSAIVDK